MRLVIATLTGHSFEVGKYYPNVPAKGPRGESCHVACKIVEETTYEDFKKSCDEHFGPECLDALERIKHELRPTFVPPIRYFVIETD